MKAVKTGVIYGLILAIGLIIEYGMSKHYHNYPIEGTIFQEKIEENYNWWSNVLR